MTKQAKPMKKLPATVAGAATLKRGRGRPPATERVEAMTIKLAPAVRTLILNEVHRRKTERLPNSSIQAVVAEAVTEKLAKK